MQSIPWGFLKRDENNQLIYDENKQLIWEGFCIDFIYKLSEVMKFDYELISPMSGKFGEKNNKGKWDGLIGDLISGVS